MGFSLLRLLRIAATVVGLLAAGATVWLWLQWQAPPQRAAPTLAPQVGGAFDLVDQNGDPRSAAGFRGQYMLVQFGYTSCPDVCSVALDKMSRALDTLAEQDPAKAEWVIPIFISVDPDRDSATVLKDYAANFHPRLVALTGTREQVERAAAAYQIYFAKVVEEPEAAAEHTEREPHDHGSHDHGDQGQDAAAAEPDYLIAHSTVMYLMGLDGGYLTHFSRGSNSSNIAQILAQRIGN